MAFSTHKTARLLIENDVLIEKWQEFVGELNLQSERITQWKFAFRNNTISPYELFNEILVEWKSKTGRSGTLETLVEVINNVGTPFHYEVSGNFITALPFLGEASNAPKLNSGGIFYGVSPSVPNFKGRDQEISNLTQTFKGPLKYALVCGLGGIGKTELVKKFAHNNSEHHHVTWLNGDTPASLVSSIHDLAEHLEIQSVKDNKNELKLLEKIAARLNNKKWLMIIDNVDDIHEKFKSVIKFTVNIRNIFVVVTSQSRSVFGPDAALLEIDHLLPKDALNLVKNSITTETSAEEIETLCNTLQYFPLALQQAIAYIIQQQRNSNLGKKFGIKEYLKEFECQKLKVFDFEPSLTIEYRKTVLITWNLTMERLRRNKKFYYDEAVNILNILAFLDSDNLHSDFLLQIHLFFLVDSAPLGWFQRLHSLLFSVTHNQNTEQKKECFLRTIQTLKEYSIMKVEDNIISVHRVVQELIRFNLDKNSKTKILDTIITNLDLETVQKTEVQHILSVWKHIQKQTQLFIKHKSLTVDIYKRLQELSLYFESLKFAENNFQLLKEKLGGDDHYTLVMERDIATSTMDLGKYKEALKQFQLILPKLQRILGNKHHETMVTANNMAAALSTLERYSEALEIYYENLEVRIKKFGKDHKDTITTKHNIATALDEQRKYVDSMPLYQEVLEWRKNKLGPNHPLTLSTRHNIAGCLFKQSKYEEALTAFENILELRVKCLGEDHADTLTTKSWLADTLRKLGQEKRALKMHNEILLLQISTLGKDHPETIYTKSRIEFLTQKRK